MIISARVIVAGEDGKMSCVSISLPEKIKSNIKKWALANIKDSDLFYIDSERGREPHIHITVRYDLYTKDAEAVTKFLQEQPAVDIRLGPISKFRESDEYDNLKIEAYGPGLQDLCHAVGEKFESKNTGRKYLPHVTLAYVKKGACDHLVGNKHFAGVRFKADHYVFLNDKAEPHHVKVASRVDYIKDDLPEEFWDKKGDSYTLKPDVEKFLKEHIFKALGGELKGAEKWVKNMLIGSSIATQFWKEDSDIDIKVVIDEDELKRSNTKFIKMNPDEIETELLVIFDKFKGKPIFQFRNHPFEIYPTPLGHIGEEGFLNHFDSIYDIYNQTWIKEPKHIDPETYDRDDVVMEGEEMAIEWAHEWDGDLGRIKRKVKEFTLVINHLKTLPAQRRKKFIEKIENLKNGLTDDIKKLSEEKDEIKQEYNDSYDSFDSDLEKFYGSVNALPEVIRIKMLYMWGYINIIKALSKILDDKEQIETSDVKKIDEALKTSAISFRTIK